MWTVKMCLCQNIFTPKQLDFLPGSRTMSCVQYFNLKDVIGLVVSTAVWYNHPQTLALNRWHSVREYITLQEIFWGKFVQFQIMIINIVLSRRLKILFGMKQLKLQGVSYILVYHVQIVTPYSSISWFRMLDLWKNDNALV